MTLRERAIAVGIDPDDPIYHDPHPDEGWRMGEDRICSWCYRHKERNPRLRCDVIRAESPEATQACAYCQEVADSDRPRLCQKCADREEANRRRWQSRWKRGSRAVRRDDGCGDVERVHPTELAIERLERSGPEDGGW